jgi:hypothetical protein
MNLTTGFLFLGMLAGTAWGQNPDLIENTRNTMKAVVQKKEMDSNATLAVSQGNASNPPMPVTGQAVGASAKSTSVVARQPFAPKAPAKASARQLKPAPAKKAQATQKIAVADKKKPGDTKKESAQTINLTGRRDPFLSPVVNRSMVGSGCSVGKRCLAVGEINLKGVVKSDVGMIAVVVNALNKAYFLRENDPVFNGYVVKITGDSIIFRETVQDRLGKPFTRDITKKIATPAV